MDNLTRRGFLKGLLAAGVAPAVVRASSLMPINQLRWSVGETLIVPLDELIATSGCGAEDITGRYIRNGGDIWVQYDTSVNQIFRL